jgi:hypothetical protein
VTPPRLTTLSGQVERTERCRCEYALVARLWIAVNDAEDRIGAVVVRVAFDRGARWGFGGILLQPWMYRLEG